MAASKKKESAPQAAETVTDTASVPRKGPLKTIRIDDVSVSIWANDRLVQGVSRTFYSATFERSYVDKTGSRKYTGFFSPDNLGKIVALCQQAEQMIHTFQQDAEAKRVQETAA